MVTFMSEKLIQFFMRLTAFRFLDQKFEFFLHLTLTILMILKISKTPVKIVKLRTAYLGYTRYVYK